MKYILFDANVISAYYLPKTTTQKNLTKRARCLIESGRTKQTDLFFYIPNFCIAEVFGTFMKYAYGDWNPQVTGGKHRSSRTVDKRVYKSVRGQFEKDIHNASLFYHYELSRYHVLSINLIAPVDHKFKISRKRISSTKSKKATKMKPASPAGTFDQLIIGMGMHLKKLHKGSSVYIVTADRRLVQLVNKCRSAIPYLTRKSLKLDEASVLTGIPFSPESFPEVIDLARSGEPKLEKIFGCWPLPVGRYVSPIEKPYLARP